MQRPVNFVNLSAIRRPHLCAAAAAEEAARNRIILFLPIAARRPPAARAAKENRASHRVSLSPALVP
jgi:hypothetical protein